MFNPRISVGLGCASHSLWTETKQKAFTGVVVADSVAGSDPSCSLVEDNYHWCCCCSWLLSQPLMVTSFSVEVKWTGLTVRCYWVQQLTQQPAPTTHSLHLCCSPYSSHSCLATWSDPVWRQSSPGTTSSCSTSLVCLLSCFTHSCFLIYVWFGFKILRC